MDSVVPFAIGGNMKIKNKKSLSQNYRGVKLDDNGYATGSYCEGQNKEFLKMNGFVIVDFPDEEDTELWKAYKLKDNKWEKDETKHKKLKEKKNKDKNNEEIQFQLDGIKKQLSELDYHTIKYIEGEYTEQEWKVYKKQKKELRKKYNDLEKGLK